MRIRGTQTCLKEQEKKEKEDRRVKSEKNESVCALALGFPTTSPLQALSSVRLLYHELLPVCIHHLVH